MACPVANGAADCSRPVVAPTNRIGLAGLSLRSHLIYEIKAFVQDPSPPWACPGTEVGGRQRYYSTETLTGFPIQNRLRSALFLDEPEAISLVGGDDTLERRGAAWLFIQYLVDRFGEDVLGGLVQTRLVGIPNVERATDRSMPFLFHEWTSALFLDGISDDPLFLFTSLDLRSEFELARQQLEEDLGEFLGIVERTLGPPAPAGTFRRQVSGLAAGYFEVSATGSGARTILLDPDGPANLQTAVFRIE